MSKDPVVIRQVTDEIVTITIPESFEPEMSMNMKIPFNQAAMQLVQYSDKAGGQLTLQQMSASDPNMRAQFEAQLNQQRQFQPETITGRNHRTSGRYGNQWLAGALYRRSRQGARRQR